MTAQFMQISIDGASYHIPLQPLDPRDPSLEVTFKPGSGEPKFRLPVFANGEWFSIPLWSAS